MEVNLNLEKYSIILEKVSSGSRNPQKETAGVDGSDGRAEGALPGSAAL